MTISIILFSSYPNQYFNRSNLTVSKSIDGGTNWTAEITIYPGPAGYSDMAKLSDGTLLILLENGAVEYDERISLVKYHLE